MSKMQSSNDPSRPTIKSPAMSTAHGVRASRVARHEAGWLLRMKDEKQSIRIDRCARSCVEGVPSLQSQCLGALAQALPLYIDEFGVEETRSALTLLPSSTLASLSVECSSLGILAEEVAMVFGGHSHVEGLSLHAPLPKPLNDKVVLSLVSRDGPQENMSMEEGDWGEDIPPMQDEERAQGCRALRRLELVNSHVSADSFAFLLQSCPSITHLSISNSFIGKYAMLDPLNGVAELLPNLKVLDLSHCSWVTDASLRSFLRQVTCSYDGKRLESLALVNVSGCPSVSALTCLQLNMEFRGKPVISTQVMQCPRD